MASSKVVLDGTKVREHMLEFCKTSKVCSKDEIVVIDRLCEVFKHYMLQNARGFIQANKDVPMLYAYSSDGTDLKFQHYATAHVGPHRSIVRRGGRTNEFLIERAFVTAKGPTGAYISKPIFRDPSILSEGKTADDNFAALRRFFGTLRECGHRGFTTSFYCFDRKFFRKLSRRMAATHRLYYSVREKRGHNREDNFRDMLKDWFVSIGCGNHDCQNGLKWAVLGLFSDTKIIFKNVYLGVAALRQCYDLLELELRPFILDKHAFRPRCHDYDKVFQFWVALGVEPDVAEELGHLDLEWVGGALYVNDCFVDSLDLFDRIYAAMLYLFRFVPFSDSRWCTAGASCRTMCCAYCVGLEEMVRRIRAKPHTSEYHIHCFDKLDAIAREFIVITALVSYVPDGVLRLLLEDDRVVGRLHEFEASLNDEMHFVGTMSNYLFRRLHATLRLEGGLRMVRHNVMNGIHIVAGYIDRVMFSQYRVYPLSLLTGDVRANLVALGLAPTAVEHTTRKIQRLVQKGYGLDELCEALDVWTELRCSSQDTEQAHAAAARMNRDHPGYGVRSLTSRSMVHLMRSLMPSASIDPAVRRRGARITKLEKIRPNKAGGKQMFLQALFAQAAARRGPGAALPQEVKMDMMAKSWGWYKQLSVAERLDYEDRAVVQSNARFEEVAQDFEHIMAEDLIRASRITQEHVLEGASSRIRNCRYTASDLDRIASLMNSEQFSAAAVKRLRDDSVLPLTVPEGVLPVLARFEPSDVEADPVPNVAFWLGRVCVQRDYFRDVALRFTLDGGGGVRTMAFLYAKQGRYSIVVQEIFFVPRVIGRVGVDAADPWSDQNPFSAQFNFTALPALFLTEHTLPDVSSASIVVLPLLTRCGNDRIHSNAWEVPLEQYLASLPPPRVRATTVARGRSEAAPPEGPLADDDLAERFPGLVRFLEPSAEGDAEADEAEVVESDCEEAGPRESAAAWIEVRDRRLELEGLGPSGASCFTVAPRGGGSTLVRHGEAYDYFRCNFRGGECQLWLRRYGLQLTKDFKLSRWGDKCCHLLCKAYAGKLQMYLDIFLGNKNLAHVYTAEECDAARLPADWITAIEAAAPEGKLEAVRGEVREIDDIRLAAPVR